MIKLSITAMLAVASLVASNTSSAQEAIYVICKINGKVAWVIDHYDYSSVYQETLRCKYEGGIPRVIDKTGNV